MNPARMFLVLICIGIIYYILKKVVNHWIGGPSREDLYRKMDREERSAERETDGATPECPLCGSPTRLYRYPHIRVWRCDRYPDCRGFLKTRAPRRMKFATDWQNKRRKKK